MINKILFYFFIILTFETLNVKSIEINKRLKTNTVKNINTLKTGIYYLTWTNDDANTKFVFELDLPQFSNNWAGFSFSEDQFMVIIFTELLSRLYQPSDISTFTNINIYFVPD